MEYGDGEESDKSATARGEGASDSEQEEEQVVPSNVVQVSFGQLGKHGGMDKDPARATPEDDTLSPEDTQAKDTQADTQDDDIEDENATAGILAFPAPRPNADYEASPEEQAKYEAFVELIDEGMVLVTLDTTREGVKVPASFAGDTSLRLNFSHRFGIDDFDYDVRGVRGSLSFQGQAFYCEVPWSAVTMLYSHITEALLVFEDLSGI